MPLPSELLYSIEVAISNVIQDSGLNPQQATFIKHIQKTTLELKQAVDPIPQSEYALQTIIPKFGDSFLQQQVALFGYAKLLLDQPDSFGGAILSEYQQDQMQAIYQYGQSLYQLSEQIIVTAKLQRRQQHNATASSINLDVFFDDETPILHYLLRNLPVQLSIQAQSIRIYANPYHLAALIQHIIKTLGHDLIEYGHIKISCQSDSTLAQINIFCTGISLNSSELDTLFHKNGHYLYPQRLEKYGGSLQFSRETGFGATIHILLSKSAQ